VKTLFAAILLAAAFPAAAQLVKCVDEKGRTHYTDKPDQDCKGAKSQKEIAPPPAPQAKPAPKAAAPKPQAKKPETPGKPAAKKELSEQEKRWYASQCKSTQDLLDMVKGPAGEKMPDRDSRIAYLTKALRDCK
jgi:hypothetical protein